MSLIPSPMAINISPLSADAYPLTGFCRLHPGVLALDLEPSAFRLYVHILNRSSKTHSFYESIRHTARRLHRHRSVVALDLQRLVDLDLITPKTHIGRTGRVTFYSVKSWPKTKTHLRIPQWIIFDPFDQLVSGTCLPVSDLAFRVIAQWMGYGYYSVQPKDLNIVDGWLEPWMMSVADWAKGCHMSVSSYRRARDELYSQFHTRPAAVRITLTNPFEGE